MIKKTSKINNYEYDKYELQKTGVYQIVNKTNGKVYYGSASESFYIRWHNHVKDLKQNNHCNLHLQRAYNKYGNDNFEFSIILMCSPQECVFHEQQYLDWFWDNCKNCYNINKEATSCLGIKRSAETCKKVSDNHADVSGKNNPMYGITRTEEWKQEQSIRMRGKHGKLNNLNIEEIKKYILNTKMSIADIAKLFNVVPSSISHMLNGDTREYCFTDEERKILLEKVRDNYTKVNGEIILQIKDLLFNTNMSLRAIAKKFNYAGVPAIIAGKTWKKYFTNKELCFLKEKLRIQRTAKRIFKND